MWLWLVLDVLYSLATGTDITPEHGSLFWWGGWIAICATVAQWPLYFAWALVSSELSMRQRVAWSVVILLGNMFAMPYFLWCKHGCRTRDGLLRLIGPAWLKQYLAQ